MSNVTINSTNTTLQSQNLFANNKASEQKNPPPATSIKSDSTIVTLSGGRQPAELGLYTRQGVVPTQSTDKPIQEITAKSGSNSVADSSNGAIRGAALKAQAAQNNLNVTNPRPRDNVELANNDNALQQTQDNSNNPVNTPPKIPDYRVVVREAGVNKYKNVINTNAGNSSAGSDETNRAVNNRSNFSPNNKLNAAIKGAGIQNFSQVETNNVNQGDVATRNKVQGDAYSNIKSTTTEDKLLNNFLANSK